MKTVTYAHKNNFGYKILEVDSNEYTVKRDLVETFIEMFQDYNCFDDYFDEFHSELLHDDELHAAITMQ